MLLRRVPDGNRVNAAVDVMDGTLAILMAENPDYDALREFHNALVRELKTFMDAVGLSVRVETDVDAERN
jgi:hypothetical protein